MIEFKDATVFSPAEFGNHLNHCFEDYVVPIQFSTALVAFLLRVEAVDLLNTIVAMDGAEVAGILMVTRRGDVMRIGAMAVAKSHRGQGLGRRMMIGALEGGRGRGERLAVLEAVEHNARAISFYQGCGFQIRHRLISGEYRLAMGGGAALNPAPFSRIATQLLQRGEGAWTWDMSPGSVMQLGMPAVGYEKDGLLMAVQPVGEDILACRAMALSGFEDRAKLTSMLQDLSGPHPGKVLKVPPYFPEPEFGDLLQDVGFDITGLSQVQMEQPL